MKLTGSHVMHAPPDRVWEALLDPAVLVATIPGCESLVATGEHAYDMTVTAGVAAITGTYAGTCELVDLDQPRSLVMKLQGAGAPGTIGATVDVRFADVGDGSTTIEYDADAVVGGMIGGVGQRMLGSVSRRMAAEFFGAVERVIAGGVVSEGTVTTRAPSPGSTDEGGGAGSSAQDGGRRVFTAPPRPATTPSPDFMRGVAVGAGLVLLGAIAGGFLGRRSAASND